MDQVHDQREAGQRQIQISTGVQAPSQPTTSQRDTGLLKMTDNIYEEIAYWQQHDEERNLELINQHELAAATEQDAACSFTQELQRRNIK